MKSQLFLFLALVLVIAQGLSEGIDAKVQFNSLSTQQFAAAVGSQETRSIVIQFSDIEIPEPPVTPVVSLNGISNAILLPFEATIQGDDQLMFSEQVVSGSASSKSCTVKVTYSPTVAGLHEAKVVVKPTTFSASSVTINLVGEATYSPGDINGDGFVNIADVVGIIDVILNDEDISGGGGDVNGDGLVNINDVTLLIDMILNTSAPQYVTTLLLTTTDGETLEHIIDENTKIKVQQSYLIIKEDYLTLRHRLSNLAQLRYGQREVQAQSISNVLDVPRAGDIYIHGLKDNATANVITPTAAIKVSENSDGTVAVNLGGTARGEYEIVPEGQTIKIVKP